MVFVTVLLGVAILFRDENVGAMPDLLLFLGNVTLSMAGWECYRRRRNSELLRWVTLIAAIGVDTLVLRHAGGANSEFVFLYFFSIASAALLIGLLGSMTMAIFSMAGFAYLLQANSTGVGAQFQLRLFVYGTNFFLTALLSSYLCEKFRQRERAHSKILGELAQTRLDTQAILDSLSTGLVVVDGELKLRYSNPAGHQILGLCEKPKPSEVEEVFTEGNPMGDAIRKVAANQCDGKRMEIELTYAESAKAIGMTASAFFDTKGDVRGYILLFSDLTQYKLAEQSERIQERLAAIGLLARDLAHEIRNPLATVRGCVELMNHSEQSAQDLATCGRLALKESDRLNNLLRDFLTFANLDIPNKKIGDLAALVRDQVRELPLSISVSDELPEHLPMLFDSDQMTLVVGSILLTLAEWSEQNGQIQLKPTNSSRSGIRFLLTDRVIPPEYKEAVFQPFSHIHKKSHGLALPTASRAMHGHGGRISLDSEPGLGTWFEIELLK
jgi:two-component system sensor histidine kinase PilS (NtrC family)